MTQHAKSITGISVAAAIGIVLASALVLRYDYLDIPRSAIWKSSLILLLPMTLLTTWYANGKGKAVLYATLGGFAAGASATILLAFPKSANLFPISVAFMTMFIAPGALIGCLLGHLANRIIQRNNKIAEQAGPECHKVSGPLTPDVRIGRYEDPPGR